jgi:hypothetical protein
MMKAFPNPMTLDRNGKTVENQVGMDLRDYFAAQVLPELIDLFIEMDEPVHTIPKNAAELAYEYADAMMKVREQNG